MLSVSAKSLAVVGPTPAPFPVASEAPPPAPPKPQTLAELIAADRNLAEAFRLLFRGQRT